MDPRPLPDAPDPSSSPADAPRAALRWGIGATSVLIAAWRLWTVPVGDLWRDWTLILAVMSALPCIAPRLRSWALAASTGMAFLLGIYVRGQWPHLVALFGGAP